MAHLIRRNIFAAFSKEILIWDIAIYPITFIFVAGYAFTGFFDKNIAIGDLYIPYSTYLTTGIVSINVMFISASVGAIIWNDKRNGMFDQIMGMPFTRFQYVFSHILTIVVLGLISAAAIFVIGLPTLIGYAHVTPLGIFYLLFSLICCSIFFGSITIIVANMMTNRVSFSFFYQLIYNVTEQVSTALYPVSGIPTIIVYLLYLNPVTYVSDLIRVGLFSQFMQYTNYEVAALSVFTLTSLILAILSIRKINL